jgi:hypothetical protein
LPKARESRSTVCPCVHLPLAGMASARLEYSMKFANGRSCAGTVPPAERVKWNRYCVYGMVSK